MAIDTELKYARLEDLSLDPLNARLGRNNRGRDVSQARVLQLMKDWELDELALSFLESGFWPQEALLVTRETLYGKPALVVIEGNRRLAALKYLHDALQRKPASRKWAQLVDGAAPPPHLFTRIPYIRVDSRKEIESFIGFRHVTGIKEWKPAEKAEYIARLIEDSRMSYEDVRRKIGSKTPAVRQHYVAYRLLRQMEDQEDISLQHVEEKFSVLYLSLRTLGVQRYLGVDIKAEPRAARRPVPPSRLKALSRFARWLFGDAKTPPLVRESRQVDDFGIILQSRTAIEYLERSDRPSFDMAFRLAGGDEPEVIKLIEKAADNLELALSRAHLYVKSPQLRLAVDRLAADAAQVLRLFPDIEKKLLKGGQ